MVSVAVVSNQGKPLSPTNWRKAKRLLKAKKAVLKTNKLGIKYLQMTSNVGTIVQPLVLASDPGSRYDGIAVGSSNFINLTGMISLPKTVAKKKAIQREMRRARRFRNTPQREKRFNNRIRPKGWIAPSQKAKVDFRLLVIKELCKIYPINTFIVEDVKFNHYKKRWGKFFSTVEIGKTYLFDELSKIGTVIKYSGEQTKEALRKYKLPKIYAKAEFVKESHANDCVAMLCSYFDRKIPDNTSLYCWKRYEFYRRQLHKREPSKGGIRERYGGSWLVNNLYKGDVVIGIYKKSFVRGVACSYDPKSKSIGIATFKKSQNWIVPLHTIQRLYHNPVLMEIH